MTPAKIEAVRAGRARPWQFSLRSLFTAVALCAALCGAMQWLGGLSAAVLGLCVLLVGSHVLGTRISVHARDAGVAERTAAGDRPPPPSAPRPIVASSRLRERDNVVRTRIVTACIVAGAVLGGAGGGAALAAAIWDRARWPGLLLGVVSSSVLGGFIGFLGSACVHVATQAVRQASGDGAPPQTLADATPTPTPGDEQFIAE